MKNMMSARICLPSWALLLASALLALFVLTNTFCSCRHNYLEGYSSAEVSPDSMGGATGATGATDASGGATGSVVEGMEGSTGAAMDASGGVIIENHENANQVEETSAAMSAELAETLTPEEKMIYATKKASATTSEGFQNANPYQLNYESATSWTTDTAKWQKLPTESSMNSRIVQNANSALDPSWQVSLGLLQSGGDGDGDAGGGAGVLGDTGGYEIMPAQFHKFKAECCKTSSISNSMGCSCD